jgi:8-oxo-dGTP pyrophosphatase MutT (NUDIX family)
VTKNKGSGIIFIAGNKVLLLQNPKKIWEIPGGKKDKNEDYFSGAQRETAEELGKCPEFKLFGDFIHENKKNKFKIYFGKVKRPFVCRLSDEHLAYKWCDINDLPQLIHKKIAGALDFLQRNISAVNNINSI